MTPVAVGFELMLYGLAGVFATLIIFYFLIRLMVSVSRKKPKKND